MRQIFLLATIFVTLSACAYTIKIKDGASAYERKQFAVAIPLLEKEFKQAKSRSDKGRIAFQLGDSYRRIGQEAGALPWFGVAYEQNYGAEALKAQAYSLKKLERYTEAREVFKNLGIEIGSPYEFRKEITACNVAEGWLKEAPKNGWQILPNEFNSPQNDFSPAFTPEGTLLFSSDRQATKNKNEYAWTGNRFMDLFTADLKNNDVQPFDAVLNSPANEGTPCFNAAGTEMFFVRAIGAYKGDDAFCKIYLSTRNAPAEAWSAPVPLPFQLEKINYVHPALSADGKTLYFSCNDPEGWGGYDLWAVQRSTKNESGWEDPKLLGRSINTTGNELFPTIEADTLYFSSDGLPGMGGLDIFRTYKLKGNTWAPPYNFKSPLNSGADDFGLLIQERTPPTSAAKPGDLLCEGFFTSNRPGGRGGDDIYRFEQRVPPPAPPKTDSVPPVAPEAYKLILEVYVLEKIFAEPDNPNSKVLGRRPLKNAVLDKTANDKKLHYNTREEGMVRLELAENTDYFFNASSTGYLSGVGKFSTKGIARDPKNPVQTFELEIVLDKIYTNKEIVLENIYYDYDKWNIRPDAEPTLNRLADMLLQNPGIRIQLGSHTDCRGEDRYNQTLSQKRAQSAVNYLIGKGIDESRLSALGYGESSPAMNCACSQCSENEHQANRRTTFKILE